MGQLRIPQAPTHSAGTVNLWRSARLGLLRFAGNTPLQKPNTYQMTHQASNRLKTNATASGGPSLDLFGYEIEQDEPSKPKIQVVKVVPTAILPQIPVRPFSVTRINATTVVIWNEP